MRFTAAAALLVCVLGCGSGGGPGGPPRTFFLGFTPFPFDGTIDGIIDALATITADADLIAMHHDDGIPWQTAFDGGTHPNADFFRGQVAGVPASHRVFLAMTPINFERDSLAPTWGDNPDVAPWNTRDFDHPDVIQAYGNHCLDMIAIHQPDYVAFAIEGNFLHNKAPDRWAAFMVLAQAVHDRLRAAHPDLSLFITISAEAYWPTRDAPADPTTGLTQEQVVQQLLALSDIVAVSSYPVLVTGDADPATLRADYYSTLAALAPNKSFAIAECGWPADSLDAPWPLAVPADEANQRAFFEFLFAEADTQDAAFIVCFVPRDWDVFWNSGLIEQSAIARFFRDIGLRAGDGTTRPALELWRERLAGPVTKDG